MDTAIVYNEHPATQALAWARLGFSWIHVVDLNGAIDGRPVNVEAVRSILSASDLPVQLGGGIRSLAQIEQWLSEGISRVILGTAAVKNPSLVKEACSIFPGQIAVGIDARGVNVAVEGWIEDSNIHVNELAARFEDAGVCAIIYTDIDRDGTGAGLNMETTIGLARSVSIPVIASGGVGSIEDVRAVRNAWDDNVSGMIIGKALYDGRIDPLEALREAA